VRVEKQTHTFDREAAKASGVKKVTSQHMGLASASTSIQQNERSGLRATMKTGVVWTLEDFNAEVPTHKVHLSVARLVHMRHFGKQIPPNYKRIGPSKLKPKSIQGYTVNHFCGPI
jgi:hypothetical protein